MAKVIGPLHSTEARGVIGGLVFNTWRGIRYVKRMTSPAQPRHSTALWLRSLAIRMVRTWQTLGTTARNDWNDYAAAHPLLDWTGIAKRVTGCNWYVGLNTRLLLMNKTTIGEPPAVVAPLPLIALSATPAAGKITVTWTPTAGTNISAFIFTFGPHSKGMFAHFPRAKYWGIAPGEGGTVDITVSQIGRYTIWLAAADESTGLLSTYQSIIGDVTTLV
jgi:hypothetical protein